MQFLSQDSEGFGDIGLLHLLSLDDGLVNLHPADRIIRLNGKHLLQGIGRAVGLQGPDLHFSEALATHLGLAP